MANDFTTTPNLWVLDTAGGFYHGIVYISKILYIPNAANDDVLFNTWDESKTVSAGTTAIAVGLEGTITSNSIMTSTGNLTSAVADGYIFRILSSDGDSTNVTRRVVQTAGNDNAITVHHEQGSWTNEASKFYQWETYTAIPAIILKAGAGDASPIQIDYGPRGRRFNNLSLETIDGGTLYVHMHTSINV